MRRRTTLARWTLATLLAWMGSGDSAATAGPRGGVPRGGVDGPSRVWTDAAGKYKVEAALAEFADGKTRLKTTEGKLVAIALDKLSPPDQRYVGQWVELKKKYPWLDANVPFDVVAFLQPIPEAENATTVYREALLEVAPGAFMYLFPPDEQERLRQIDGKRWDQFARLNEAWSKDPKSVNLAELDAWLAEYETGFKKLALAQQRTAACVFQNEYRIDWVSPDLNASLEVERVTKWRTRRDLQRGDFDRAIQAVETVLRLARDVRNKGPLLAQLRSVAMEGTYCEQVIPEILLV